MITLDFVSFAPWVMTLCKFTTKTDTVINQNPTGKSKIHLCIHLREAKNSSTDGTPLIQSIGNNKLAFMFISIEFKSTTGSINNIWVVIITLFFSLCSRKWQINRFDDQSLSFTRFFNKFLKTAHLSHQAWRFYL